MTIQMMMPKKHISGQDSRAKWGRFEPGDETFIVTSTDTQRPWTYLISNCISKKDRKEITSGWSEERVDSSSCLR